MYVHTLAGRADLLSITATGHGRAADYWAYGVLLFELLAGYPPFFDDNPLGIYEKILNGKFGFPPHIDFVAKDLIKRLLTADLSKRLGNLHDGADGIKNHRWFEGVDWTAVERKQIRVSRFAVCLSCADDAAGANHPVDVDAGRHVLL